MDKVWAWIKKFWLALLAIIAALIAAGRKPKWIKDKEREVKQREKEIERGKQDLADLKDDYGGVKKEHDEKIAKAKEAKGEPVFSDPDDAASYLDGILRKIKGD